MKMGGVLKHRLAPIALNALKQGLVDEGIKRIVVGAIIARGDGVLLLERSATDYLGGLVEFPSGTVEPGEELLDALVREVAEETGLVVTMIEGYVNFFDYNSRLARKTRQFNFLVRTTGTIKLNPEEHVAYFIVQPNDVQLRTLNISVETKAAIMKAC